MNLLVASLDTFNATQSQIVALPGILDPVRLLNSFGHWMLGGLLLVVFIESGMLFPFLPGDSLLFTAGLLSAQHEPFAPLWLLIILIPVAAISGDQCGYWIGHFGGAKLFHSNDAKVFKKQYLEEAHAFFEKWGPATVILARFVPIVRTFFPLVAGASRMRYSIYLGFDIIGGLLWGAGVTLLGYFLGNITFIKNNIEAIFIFIVFISVLPIFSQIAKGTLQTMRKNSQQTDNDDSLDSHPDAAQHQSNDPNTQNAAIHVTEGTKPDEER